MTTSLADHFSKDGFNLRCVKEADIDTLVLLINQAYSYQEAEKGEPRTNPDDLRNRIAETDFYVITHRKQIIGCVYIEPQGTALHFGLLTLVPEYRGKGIAQRVLSALDAYAQANEFVTLDLDYMSVAPWLKTYYEKYGFTETDEIIKWDTINLIHMSKHLRA